MRISKKKREQILDYKIRITNLYIKKSKKPISEIIASFNKCKVWNYLEECYDLIATYEDKVVLNDIKKILKKGEIC